MDHAGAPYSKACVWIATCVALGCAASPDEAAEVSQSILGDCSFASVVSPEDRQPDSEAPVSITSEGVCIDGSAPEFRVSVQTPLNRKLVVCDWQREATCTWTASGQGNGTFLFTVDARRPGDESLSATKRIYYAIGGSCTAARLSATPENPRPGELVRIVAEADCDAGVVPEYNFRVTAPGGPTIALGKPQLSPEVDWDTTGLAAGVATLRLDVRAFGSRIYDVSTALPFAIGDACTAGSLRVVARGSERLVSATASCTGEATAEYRFSVFAPDGTETLLRDFTAEPSTTWDATGLEGTHRVRVSVRAAENPDQLASSRDRSVVLADACNAVSLLPIAGPVVLGGRLELTASAPCSDGEFAFQLRASTAAAWNTVCAYSDATTCVWDVPEGLTLGSYVARALVRKAGSVAAQDAASASQSFAVEPGISVLRIQDLVGDRFLSNAPLLSGDGSTMVLSTFATQSELFLWNERAGIEPLPSEIWVNDLSFDGSTLVGGGAFPLFQQAIRWTREFGVEGLGVFPGLLPFSQALSVSGDGQRVVGESSTPLGIAAFEWTSASPFTELLPPLLGGGRLHAANADARVLLTRSANFSSWARWTPQTGARELALPGGAFDLSPETLSGDGRFVVGSAADESTTFAVIWDELGAAQDLTETPVAVEIGSSFALAASADASRVFGGADGAAFVWDSEAGLRPLAAAYPQLLGALSSGELPVFVSDASADGRVLIVFAESEDRATRSYYRVVLPF